jgi:hypothetical protein
MAPTKLSRRDLILLTGAAGMAAVRPRAAGAQTIRRTARQIQGLFYPVHKPLDQNADLSTIAGRDGRAPAAPFHLLHLSTCVTSPLRGQGRGGFDHETGQLSRGRYHRCARPGNEESAGVNYSHRCPMFVVRIDSTATTPADHREDRVIAHPPRRCARGSKLACKG